MLNAQTWNLQQCIDHALENNLQVRQAELNTELSKSLRDQSIAGFLPSLNGSASQNHYFGRSIDPITNAFTTNEVRSNSFNLSSSLSVFEGFQLQNTLRQSSLSFLSSRYDLQKIRNDISLNVVTLYLQALYTKELELAASEQLEATRFQKDRVNRMFELGSLSKSALLEIEAQFAADELRQIQARNNYEQSLLNLAQLLELPSVKDFSIQDPMLSDPSLPAEALTTEKVYAQALGTQPEIMSYDLKAQSAQKGLAVARGGRYPRLLVTGNINTNFSTSGQEITGYNVGIPSSVFSGFTSSGDSVYSIVPNTTPIFERTAFRDQLDNNLSRAVGFSLQIPIFNGWAVKTNVSRARINLEQARLNLDQTKKNLYKSVQQAVLDAAAASQKFNASKKSNAAQEESYKINSQRFELGLVSSYEFLQAKNLLAASRAELLQSKYDFIFRLKVIDFYMGKKLTF